MACYYCELEGEGVGVMQEIPGGDEEVFVGPKRRIESERGFLGVWLEGEDLCWRGV